MKTTKFVVEAKKHQAKNNKSGKAGCYRGRGNYAHILPIDSNTKEAKWDAIKKYVCKTDCSALRCKGTKKNVYVQKKLYF